MKKPLIVIAGPTASGKTALSVSLAKAIGGEIISADSMQVYRKMNIGSAKIRPEETEGVPHHLIDILEPDQPFHIVRFKELADKAVREVLERGHIPILTGGTGFYIQAVTRDIDFSQAEQDDGTRQELEKLAEEKGAVFLHEMLEKVDPASASELHPNNVKRVIRALEFYDQTGRRISDHNEEQKLRETPYNLAYFVLSMPREEQYRRIDQRVDQMMEEGLLDEVSGLRKAGCRRGMTSMQGLGYKEMLDYLDGFCSLDEAVRILKRDTRHFAKRQLTWFRREKDVIWISQDEFGYDRKKILDFMLNELRIRSILSQDIPACRDA